MCVCVCMYIHVRVYVCVYVSTYVCAQYLYVSVCGVGVCVSAPFVVTLPLVLAKAPQWQGGGSSHGAVGHQGEGEKEGEEGPSEDSQGELLPLDGHALQAVFGQPCKIHCQSHSGDIPGEVSCHNRLNPFLTLYVMLSS